MSESTLQVHYAGLLESLTAAMRQHWAWPSPEAGFAGYFLNTINEVSPTSIETLPSSHDQLIHAPSLAFIGFELASKSSLDRRDEWLAGLDRLKARNAFPADRQSFAYRPLEALGIAVGIRACDLQSTEIGGWLKSVLMRTRKEQSSVWSACLHYAAEVAIEAPGARPPILEDARDLLDLCAIKWLDHLRGSTSQELDRRILEVAAIEQWQATDAAQAVMVYHMLRAAVRRSIYAEVERNWPLGRELQTAETRVLQICRRFHRTAQQLLQRHDTRGTLLINDEYDVQDLMHAILVMFFDDVRPETPTPNYAGHSSRTDFVLWKERIIVEAKMTRAALGQKKVADQLILDKQRYASDPRCGTLICFVYDPGGFCENPEALETDLSQDIHPRTRVVVYSSRL